jgi:hypothetical protein
MEPTDTDLVKRRTAVLIVLSCLALATAALASGATPGDGTLSVRNGDGSLRLVLERGVAIGRIGSGQLTVVDPEGGTCDELLVWDDGERAVPLTFVDKTLPFELRCLFKGTNLRFRLGGPEGATLRVVNATGISLSAVGAGSGRIKGLPFDTSDGTYAVNGDLYVSLPDDWKVFQLEPPDSGG